MSIDTQLQPFIDGLARAWPEPAITLGVQAWRERAEALAGANRAAYPQGLSVEDLTIAGMSRSVTVRVYRPPAAEALPGLLYMHGGGWVVGSHETHDSITAAIAAHTPTVVISVHYARAPEHPYPCAVEDCRAALEWVHANAASLGIDRDSIFTGGDSAGGNLATVLAWLYRHDEHIRLRGQVLIYPCVDTDFHRPSYLTEANAPFMTAKEMIWFWQQYCPDPAARLEPMAVPMRAGDYAGMPAALITVAEHDVLRDEGTEYAARLSEAGVSVSFRPGVGLIHGHLRATGMCQAAAREFEAVCDWSRSTAQPSTNFLNLERNA